MVTKASRGIVGVFCALVLVVSAAAAQAAIVWELNPAPRQNGPAGNSALTYTSSGFSITARGFDNHAGIGAPHELFFKNQTDIGGSVEFGLGLTNTLSNEIQPGLHFIQFDFSSALAAGLMHGQISVGSVQPGETFAFFGSNTLGTLGTQVGGPFGSNVDDKFVAIPGFGQFSYYSVVALANDVLPIALQADLPPVPEMNALLPIIGLFGLIAATTVWRKRRAQA